MTGKNKIDVIILGVSTLVSIGTAFIFYYTIVMYERPLPNAKLEKKKFFKENQKVTLPKTFKMDKQIINLISNRRRLRFLEITMHLVPFKEKDIPYFKNNKAKINDALIDIVGKMTPNELNSISGKILLENRIKKSLVSSFGANLIKNIYYTRFVIQ